MTPTNNPADYAKLLTGGATLALLGSLGAFMSLHALTTIPHSTTIPSITFLLIPAAFMLLVLAGGILIGENLADYLLKT